MKVINIGHQFNPSGPFAVMRSTGMTTFKIFCIPTRDGSRMYDITGWQQQETVHTRMKRDAFVVILSTRLPDSNPLNVNGCNFG